MNGKHIAIIGSACAIIAVGALLGAYIRESNGRRCSAPSADGGNVRGVKMEIPQDYDQSTNCVKRSIWAGEKEMARLSAVWADAASDIESGKTGAAKVKISQIAERMKTIGHEQQFTIIQPFERLIKQRFDANSIADNFTDADSFYRYMRAGIEGMNMLSDIQLRANYVPDSVPAREGDALAALNSYRRIFVESGDDEKIRRADKLIAELIAQIESEKCLTLRYMRYRLGEEMRLLVSKGIVTREHALRGARSHAFSLEQAGYVPKWIDEFKE